MRTLSLLSMSRRMGMQVERLFRSGCLLASLLIIGVVRTEAHRVDEYLQAALIAVESNEVRLQLTLTPGVELADPVLWMIDLNRDGQISAQEQNAYAALAGSGLGLWLDGQPLPIALVDAEYPPFEELKTGLGRIQMRWKATLDSLSSGNHEVKFQNRHRPEISAYLANAVGPLSARIQILRQSRNENQSELRIPFLQTGSSAPLAASASSAASTLRKVSARWWTSVVALGVGAAFWFWSRRERELFRI